MRVVPTMGGMPSTPADGAPAGPDRTGLRLMHVHAHPDDESSKGAASTAKYVAEGVDVHVATCTGGERGSILNHHMDRPDVLAKMWLVRNCRFRTLVKVRGDFAQTRETFRSPPLFR